jgi:hypothetical protein
MKNFKAAIRYLHQNMGLAKLKEVELLKKELYKNLERRKVKKNIELEEFI